MPTIVLSVHTFLVASVILADEDEQRRTISPSPAETVSVHTADLFLEFNFSSKYSTTNKVDPLRLSTFLTATTLPITLPNFTFTSFL